MDFDNVHIDEATKNAHFVSILDSEGRYKYQSPGFFKMGFMPNKTSDYFSAFDSVHPDDISKASEAFGKILKTAFLKMPALRFKNASGEYRWIQSEAANMLDHPSIGGIILNCTDVTDAIKDQNLNQEYAARYKALFYNNPNLVITVNPDGFVIDANQHIVSVFGCAIKEIFNIHFSHFSTPAFRPIINKTFKDAQSGSASSIKIDCVDKSGIEFPVEIMSIPVVVGGVLDCIQLIINSLKTQKLKEKELETLAQIASKTKNSIFITDKNDCIEWVNKSLTEATGYKFHDILGKRPLDFLKGKDTDKETIKRIEAFSKSKIQFREEMLNYTADGDEIWFMLEATPILNDKKELVRTFCILTDITEQKKAESELIKLAKDLTRQNCNLQQFTYIISHNLRSPLASAIGLTELINAMGPQDPFYPEGMALLSQSLKSLDDVIHDINKILSVQINLEHFEEVNLFSLVCEVLLNMQNQIDEEQALVKLAIDKNFTLSSIKSYLYSIIVNLVSNSLKYRNRSSDLKITISAIKCGTESLIFISDNGIGIDLKKYNDQIFRLYKRFTPDIEGKGLGLYLVKTQVEELGGKINVESQPGHGTSFVISLPEHL